MLVHHRVTPSNKIASTYLYTWIERGTVRVVSCPRLGLESGQLYPELKHNTLMNLMAISMPNICIIMINMAHLIAVLASLIVALAGLLKCQFDNIAQYQSFSP